MCEDDRMLWCGNLSENVTEEILYELFLQAGPLENVKIPRDGDRRQRSYAFITYVHAASVEYAINIFEGTSLFQRQLTLHKKTRNGSNPVASPQINFNHPSTSNSRNYRYQEDSSYNHLPDNEARVSLEKSMDGLNTSHEQNDLLSAIASNQVYGQTDLVSTMIMMMNSNPASFTPEVFAQFGQQMLGAELPPYDDQQQQSSMRTKMHRNDRSHYNDRHHNKPYSREDRHGHHGNRHESHSRHRYDSDHRRNSDERDRNSRRRR
uniref:RRM domain-containing protein n=1 Tax=Anopheles farauti TaxID=69004 RepID=A0A182QRW0_9DIPT